MPNDLTFLYTGSSGPASDYAWFCAETARVRGFSATAHSIAEYPAAQLLAGGTVLLFLGNQEDEEPHGDAISFWLYLNSLNFGALKNLHFAVHALGDKTHDQFCSFGNACNIKLGQLGGFRLHPLATCDRNAEPNLHEWMQLILARLSSSRSSRLEAVAA